MRTINVVIYLILMKNDSGGGGGSSLLENIFKMMLFGAFHSIF